MLWITGTNGVPRPVSIAGGATAELVPDHSNGWGVSIYDFGGRQTFEGYAAWRVVAAALQHRNRFGASHCVIEAAVGHIEAAGESHSYLDQVARTEGRIARLPPTRRIALEISLHEMGERQALTQDLSNLTNEWREAEEIARIADDLLTPESVSQQISRLRDSVRTNDVA